MTHFACRCKNTVFVDKSEHAATEILVCPLQGCTYAWCKSCSQKIEFGGPKHSCDGSSELKHLMQQRGWKYCPGMLKVHMTSLFLIWYVGCKTPAEKIDGCNHMTVCSTLHCNARLRAFMLTYATTVHVPRLQHVRTHLFLDIMVCLCFVGRHFCYVCGEAITQSALRSEIKSALSAHYRRCRLFEDVA